MPIAIDSTDVTLSGEIKLRRKKAVSRKLRTDERRGKPRLTEAFPASVWGIDTDGKTFESDCALDNISSTGLYVRVPRAMNLGAEINFAINFMNGQGKHSTAVVLGRILRDEPQADGRHGIAVAIKEHHFI